MKFHYEAGVSRLKHFFADESILQEADENFNCEGTRATWLPTSHRIFCKARGVVPGPLVGLRLWKAGTNTMRGKTKAAWKGQKEGEGCPTRLLDDLPADHDAFGPHQRIAKAIADLIKNEKSGKAIALVGPWGSGKSTIVRLLKKSLEGSKDIGVFVFDAWEHQGDPLRRSFLERFIDWLLDEKGWLSKRDRWLEEKEKIARRIRFTRRFPRFTPAGSIIALTTLLVPVGLGLLSLGKTTTINLWIFQVQALHLGLGLSVTPFVLLAIISLCSLLHPRLRKFFVGREIPYKDVLSLLLAGRIEESEEHETPDPTSIEFRSVFEKAVSEALGRKNHRQLVIVVDNLDRVSVEDALKIWATLRPFFKREELTRQSTWDNRLWLIVPFAPEMPQRLWKDDSQDKSDLEEVDQEKERTSLQQEKSKAEQLRRHKSLADEFVEKTFQIRFYVPLPVMSDWRKFFLEQLSEEEKGAFPKHFQRHLDDLHAIYWVFDAKRASNHRPPTPREIKLFINQLGAYHRIWQDKIPLPVQAWYVLTVHDLIVKHGPEKVLVEKYEELLGQDVKRFFKHEPRLQEYLAALYFTVEVNKAMQVLIGDEVREALQLGDGKRLRKIQKNVPPEAFFTVVEREISSALEGWIAQDPPTLARAALALRDLTQDDSLDWKSIWQWLIDGAQRAAWSDLDEQVGEGLVTLLQKSGDQFKSVGESLLKNLKPPSGLEKEEQKQELDTEAIDNWVKGLARLLLGLRKLGGEDLLQKFQIPGDAAFYVEVMRSAVQLKDGGKVLLQLKSQASGDEVVRQLADLCSKAKLDKYYAEVVRVLAKKGWNWSPLVDAVKQRLGSQQKIGSDEAIGCLRTLLYLGLEEIQTAPSITQVFEELAKRGGLFHCMSLNQGNNEVVSLCVLAILEHNPEGELISVPSGSQANNGLQLYKSILKKRSGDVFQLLASLTEEFHKGDALLQSAVKVNEAKPLILSVLSRVIEEDYINGYPSAGLVVAQYRFLKEGLQKAIFKKLLRRLAEKGDLLDAIQHSGFDVELVGLYLEVLSILPAGESKERFIQFLHEHLRDIQKEEWQSQLLKEGPLLELVIALAEEGASPALGRPFHGALLEHAKQVLQGSTFPTKFRDRWDRVCQALDEHSQETLLRNIRDELLINQADKNSQNLLALYGHVLITSKVLEDPEKSDDLVRRCFLRMLERKSPPELEWMERVLKENPKVFEQSREATQEAFSEAVLAAWEEAEDEDVRRYLKGIAEAIGLGLPEKEEPPQDNAEPKAKEE